jgi:hypothetical protein
MPDEETQDTTASSVPPPPPSKKRRSLLPKKADGALDLKRLATWIGYTTAILGALSAVWTGFTSIKDRLDLIESSAVGVADLKQQNQDLRDLHEATEERIMERIGELAAATRNRFRQNETAAQDLRIAIERMQAAAAGRGRRSGYVRFTGPPVHFSTGAGSGGGEGLASPAEAERAAQRALIRSGNQAPQGDPLAEF